jgi:signal transduction histidine kinase
MDWDILQITTVAAAVVAALANVYVAFSDGKRFDRELLGLRIVRSQSGEMAKMAENLKDMFDQQVGLSQSLLGEVRRLVKTVTDLVRKQDG